MLGVLVIAPVTEAETLAESTSAFEAFDCQGLDPISLVALAPLLGHPALDPGDLPSLARSNGGDAFVVRVPTSLVQHLAEAEPLDEIAREWRATEPLVDSWGNREAVEGRLGRMVDAATKARDRQLPLLLWCAA